MARGGIQIITGNFGGDGRTDVGLVRREPGWATVPVALSSATNFEIQNRAVGAFAGWAATERVQVITGDFDANGRTDVGLVRREPGWATIPVVLSNGADFTVQNRPAGDFAGWATTAGVQVITGDFNGDGRMDIGLVRQTPGWTTLPVALSSSTDFGVQNRPVGEFAAWAATGGVQVLTGDFNGDGSTDIGLVRQAPGWATVPVALSSGTDFATQNRPVGDFAGWAATSGVQVLTGDFNGDGRTDIALVRQEPGWATVPVALSSATGFQIQNRPVGDFAGWAATSGVQVLTGDFNSDGRTDIALVRREPGWATVPVALSSATGFQIQNRPVGEFAAWAATEGVKVITGDFNGGGTDLGLVRQTAGWATVPVALSSSTGFTIQNRSVGDFAGWAASSGNTQQDLLIRRFATTRLSNAEADAILADATTVLQTNDGAGDAACAMTFSRDGDVTAFTNGDGSIDSQAEFSNLIDLPGWVKAVNTINWCGGLIPNVIGCAPVPGNSLAVVRFQAALEGILWAHEFGHNKGLGHRNDDPNAIMNGTIAATRLRMTQAECNALRSAPLLALASQEIMPAAGAAGQMPVEEFVRQVFIHGVPYPEASQYGSAAVPKLLEMLNDPAEEAWWPNIVVVLGMIGDPSVVDPMISFIEEDEGELSREHYVAKTSALMSLGYVVNKTGEQRALEYLKAALDPEIWQHKNVGQAPFQASATERNRDFSKYAILGLALSGRPEAAEALRSLQQPAETETHRAFQAQVSDLVSQALKEHQAISDVGLMRYYKTSHPE